MPQEAKTGYEIETDFDSEFDVEPTPEPKASGKTPPEQLAAPPGKDAPPSLPAHNSVTLHFAREFGIPEDEIAASTPKELDLAVRIAHKAMMKSSKDFRRNEDREQVKPAFPVEDSVPNGAVKKPEDDELAEFDATVDPNVLLAIKKGREADRLKIESLQKKVDENEGRERQRFMQAQYDAVDAEFAKMPAAVQGLIGKGTRHTIEAGSLQHTIRKHILEAAEKDGGDGTFAEKMHRAAKALVPASGEEAPKPSTLSEEYAEEIEDEVPAPAPKPVPPKNPVNGKFESKTKAEREESFRTSGSAKPTSRESPLPKGEKRAMETARKIMISRGMLDESDVPEGAFPK